MALIQTELKSMKIREQGQQSNIIYGPSGDTAGDTIIYSGTATDSGTYTFSAEVRVYVSGYYGCLDININGNTVETFRTDNMSYVSFSYETQIEVGDTIQLHLYGTPNQYGVCNNVQITNTITTLVEKDIKRVTMRPLIKDTQGPCANGYHVPSREENVALVDAMTTLGIDTSTGACMKTYLKMPYAGYRNYTNSNATAQGVGGRYWACTRLNVRTASTLAFGAASVTPQSNANTSYGFSIRPFKNEAVIPDSTWTTLFDGSLIATNAGIFHNTTDGIISISADGTNWITIADKNLGATVVYNDGDTLAETNCGGYFQWGNNYMFPFTGTVTTSSTQVDASNYGPGNWYSSSTFITGNSDWSSVQNDNLRGEAVGVLTEKQIRPAGPTPRPIITGITYDNKSFYNGGQEQQVQGIFFKPDGTKMYLSGEGFHRIHQYTLSTPRDISTATYDNKSKTTTEFGNGAPSGLYISDDGVKLYLSVFQQKKIGRYTLSTPRDISTAVFDNVTSFTANNEMPCFCFGDNGKYLYYMTQTNLTRYKLNTPYDITSNDGTTQVINKNWVICYGIQFNPQGTQLFFMDRDYINAASRVRIYNLSTARDLSSATLSQELTPTLTGDYMAQFIGDNGNKIYLGHFISGNATNYTIYQYNTINS